MKYLLLKKEAYQSWNLNPIRQCCTVYLSFVNTRASTDLSRYKEKIKTCHDCIAYSFLFEDCFCFLVSPCFPKHIKFGQNFVHKNTDDGVFFSVVTYMWAYGFLGLHHRCFSMKIVNFHRTLILQNNAARLLLISCSIFDVWLALSVKISSVIAWRYNIGIMSVLILVLYYHIGISINISLYLYNYISINITNLVLYLHGHN